MHLKILPVKFLKKSDSQFKIVYKFLKGSLVFIMVVALAVTRENCAFEEKDSKEKKNSRESFNVNCPAKYQFFSIRLLGKWIYVYKGPLNVSFLRNSNENTYMLATQLDKFTYHYSWSYICKTRN